MPRIASKADQPTRHRSGVGRSRVYDIDLSPLEEVVGKKDDEGNDMAVIFGPEDLLAGNGEVAQLPTFLAQAREWMAQYNENHPKQPEYRIKASNFPITDENGNHIAGTWDKEKNEPVPSNDPDAVKLYESWVYVIEMTDRDRKNREARAAARRRSSGNTKTETKTEATETTKASK